MLGIIAGLKIESSILAYQGVPRKAIDCEGMGPERAAHAACNQIAAGARLLISFGIAGGVTGNLAPGTLILPYHVLEKSGIIYDTDAIRRSLLYSRMADQQITIAEDSLLGVDSVIATSEKKTQLASAYNVAAIDMESHVVACEARKVNLPFLVVRAIADDIKIRFPPALINSFSETGQIYPMRLLRGLAKAPSQTPSMLRLGYATLCALNTLRLAARVLASSSSELIQGNA